MSFASPWLLLVLLVVPVAIVGYVVLERQRAHRAATWSKSALMPNMIPARPGLRRYAPLVLFMLALILLLAGFARPQATRKVPHEGATIVLAIDISGSMEAKDVERADVPGLTTRLLAARAAATKFLDDLPDKYRVSLVTFGNRGTVRIPPTNDQEKVALALPTKANDEGTQLASGLERATKVAQSAFHDITPGGPRSPAAILVISDGSNTSRNDPHAAADKARKLGIPISAVLLGTAGPLSHVTQKLAGGPPGSANVIQVPVVPGLLQDVTRTTGGQFFESDSEQGFDEVWKNIQSQIVKEKKKKEITVWLAGGAIVLLVGGALLSGVWFRRLV